VMPYTDTQPALPWQGKTSHAKHCSHEAAVSASETRVWKSGLYLSWLKQVGKATDEGADEHFGWGRSTICSVRNGLVDRGLVTSIGVCKGAKGKQITIWGPK
jgi:hypothetical protein